MLGATLCLAAPPGQRRTWTFCMPTRPPPSPSSDAETWLTAKSADPSSEGEDFPAGPSLIGTTLLGTYTIDRVLGEGGMGRVYAAHHARLANKHFAVKVLRPELVSSNRIRARFEREVHAIARIDHPGVLSLVDVGTTEQGWPFMVSEYLSGLDLSAYLRRFGAMSKDQVVRLGCRISEALEATHERGVIHRDIKPSNVFLLGSFEGTAPQWERVKLIDFGLSRLVNSDDDLTKTGIVMGTPSYMSPEQARGQRSDHLTDVYGVGAVMYAAATASPPFAEETQQLTVIAVIHREPVRPRELNAGITEDLEVVIQRAMAKEPAQRQPTMGALRAALAKLEASAVAPRGRAGAKPLPSVPGVRGVRVRLVALASFAALLTLVGVLSVVTELKTFAPGYDLQLSVTEVGLLAVVLLGVSVVWLRDFGRRVWGNTAALADWLPRLRTPVVSALVVYGLASFVLHSGDLVERVVGAEHWLSAWDSAGPVWAPLLALVALGVAAVVALRDSGLFALPRFRAWWPPVASAALLVMVALGRWAWLADAGAGSSRVEAASVEPMSAQLSLLPTSAEVVPAEVALADVVLEPQVLATADAGGSDAGGDPREPSSAGAVVTAVSPALNTAPSAELRPPTVALAVAAVERTVVRAQSEPTPAASEPELLRARIMAHASRASELPDAVLMIERLFLNYPETVDDPVLGRILRSAAQVEGAPARAALRVMGEGMGSRGPDLLYDLMLHRPLVFEAAKYRLTRFRVRKLFSPELAIAYDLRFAPSCAARLSLLERAEREGDQRSVNVLSELVGKHQRCGHRGVPCLSSCPDESAQFIRSIDSIVRRLRPEQTASLN
jgi:tRNA A-37 threonylcarbamoyl transferase component Bud32